MAIGIHVARTAFVSVDRLGTVIDKCDVETTIGAVLQTEHQHRMIVDSAIPNTATRPTVKVYLELEAGDDYALGHIDQSTVITYKRTASGGFAP
jgi:hypothetical protein